MTDESDINVEALVDEADALREEIERTTETTTTADIAGAVREENEDHLIEIIAEGEDDRTAIRKWFRAERDDHPEVVHRSEDYCVVRTSKHSQRKAQYGDGLYHAVWVVGRDRDDRFFIHRLPHDTRFEDDDCEWDDDLVADLLGVNAHLGEDNPIEPEMWYRIVGQGDLRLRREEFEDYLNSRVDRLAGNRVQNREDEITEAVRDEIDPSVDHNDAQIRYSTVRGFYVTVDTAEDTDALKALQSNLNIPEDEVRERMSDRWDRLTAGRRQTCIERILRDRHIAPTKEEIERRIAEIDKDAIEAEVREHVLESVEENAGRNHARFGNHLVSVEYGDIRTDPFGQPDGTVIVPDETQLVIDHDEHGAYRRSIPAGRYEFDFLEAHQRE